MQAGGRRSETAGLAMVGMRESPGVAVVADFGKRNDGISRRGPGA